jgi:hypothetical protein
LLAHNMLQSLFNLELQSLFNLEIVCFGIMLSFFALRSRIVIVFSTNPVLVGAEKELTR